MRDVKFVSLLAGVCTVLGASNANATVQINTYTTSTMVPAWTWANPVVRCPSGTLPVGGGWESQYGNGLQIKITSNMPRESQPGVPEGWHVWAYNDSSSGAFLNVKVSCASGLPSGAYVRSITVGSSVAAYGVDGLYTPDCNGGVRTAVGFGADWGTTVPWQNYGGVIFTNSTNSASGIQATSICLYGAPGTTVQERSSNTWNIARNGTMQGLLQCPSGTQLTGGGYQGADYYYGPPPNGSCTSGYYPNNWEVVFSANAGLTTYAFCASFP